MDVIFKAAADIKKGQMVKLSFKTGQIETVTQEEMDEFNAVQARTGFKLQPNEAPDIIEHSDHSLDDLLI